MNIVEKIASIEDMSSCVGASDEQIMEAEKALGLKFSYDYSACLRAFGLAAVNGHELTGLGKTSYLNVVDVTETERKNNTQISGNLYVIEKTNIDGIIVWQDMSGIIYTAEPGCNIKKVCDSLSEYIDL